MDIHKLLREEKAVSPVIGVILMVAITVILAAVIGTFVLGLGDQVSQSQPNANIAFNYTLDGATDDYVGVTHRGGDKLDGNQLDLSVGGTTDSITNLDSGAKFNVNGTNQWNSDSITAGDQVVVSDGVGASIDIQNGDTARIIWTADGSGDTAIIAEGTVQ